MPTRAELAQAQPIVNDLTADDLRALKSKEKKPGDVAAAHLDLADKADTEAGKYLLLQGAFRPKIGAFAQFDETVFNGQLHRAFFLE